MMDSMEKILEEQLGKLGGKSEKFARWIKNGFFGLYKAIKPLLTIILTLWIFSRIKDRIGLEETVFILLVLIFALQRIQVKKLSELLG